MAIENEPVRPEGPPVDPTDRPAVSPAADDGAPLGMHRLRLDSQGRLKLPPAFKNYFAAKGQRTFFITSLDRVAGYIYPLPVWRENLKFIETFRTDPKKARHIKFNANDLGDQDTMDAQGRLTLPAKLRTALGIENQFVQLYTDGEHLAFLSAKVYGERQAQAQAAGPEDVLDLIGAGLK